MDTGQILHIVVTVLAILGAGAVALACDLLKTSNERLRQMNLELRVRREEEQRRTELALDQLRRVQTTADRALAAASGPARLQGSLPATTTIGIMGLLGGANAEQARATPAGVLAEPAKENGNNKQQPGATLEETRLLARGLLVTTRSHTSGTVAPSPATAPAPEPIAQSGVARKNWEMLLRNAARTRGRSTVDIGAVTPPVKHRGELIPFESLQSSQDSVYLPGGFHESGGLSHLLESRTPLRGMVIAVGMNAEIGTEGAGPRAGALVEAVEGYLRSILEPSDFASSPVPGRYLIVTPDRDSAAQRRFDDLTGKLWNFQLRRAATDSALFCCGGYEANGEPLAQAVGAAAAHMEANRGTQAPPFLETVRLRRAV